ncbi:MAG: hypothetical protein AMJ45_03740 [Syntrophobacter sp. DG_60]|nr:MAG: hypothetical protein AMJ45_03740 [Syntrophobacter sp. DG_60]
MAIVEISVIPLGTPTPSVSKYVAASFEVLKLKGSNLEYKLTPMGTVIEGDLDVILPVVRQMHEACFKNGIKRVVTLVEIDDRRDKTATMEDKIQSVLQKL